MKHFHPHPGWDHFTPDPGTQEKMFCRVCESEMDVIRNVQGPTGWAEAMSKALGKGEGHLHDTFSCQFAQEDWHNQARILMGKIEKMNDEPSRNITELNKKTVDLLNLEIREILETRKVTKEGYYGP